ncbi:EamA family transporter RarD [Actinokineospora sp. G85]|uniref:EamA family transporter RarD n=1 Tax=Actinokineospora sp. G85 TaxID=3406626 RepID=UPI003C72D623
MTRPVGETPTRDTPSRFGVFASVAASTLFGVVFLMAADLEPLNADQLLAWRLVVTLPVVAVLYTAFKTWADVRALLSRLRARPALIAVLVLDGHLLGVQLWLFGWAPQSGHGLDAALGYLLLPLVMVAVGALLHRERLAPLRLAAVGSAAVGVTAAVVLADGLSWLTLVIALGIPVYFTVRRRARLDTAGALGLELLAMTPFAAWLLAQPSTWRPLVDRPTLIPALLLFGLVSATAFLLYTRASAVLPFAVFGLLGYLEPVLLVIVAATLLDEPLTPADAPVYVPIAVALGLLAVETLRARPVPPRHTQPNRVSPGL